MARPAMVQYSASVAFRIRLLTIFHFVFYEDLFLHISGEVKVSYLLRAYQLLDIFALGSPSFVLRTSPYDINSKFMSAYTAV